MGRLLGRHDLLFIGCCCAEIQLVNGPDNIGTYDYSGSPDACGRRLWRFVRVSVEAALQHQGFRSNNSRTWRNARQVRQFTYGYSCRRTVSDSSKYPVIRQNKNIKAPNGNSNNCRLNNLFISLENYWKLDFRILNLI